MDDDLRDSWAEQVDDDPPRWMGWFRTARDRQGRSCRHRHHTLQAALACADARYKAISRAERYA